MRHLLRELKRRKVFRVVASYVVAGFVVIEAADIVLPRLGVPGWTVTLVIVLVALGLPLALVLAWAFDLTPQGVRRTGASGAAPSGDDPDTDPAGGEAALRGMTRTGWIAAASAAVVMGGMGWWVLGGSGAGASGERSAVEDPAASAPAEERPRLAVLPFDDIAPDSADAFFAAGMHEEVLNQLAKVSGLEVISRTSVMQYDGSSGATVQEIGRELGGVTGVLEGTVRRAGDRVRITAQLIDVRRDAHLWSETYDRELSVEAIFDIQASIAREIARALEARLTDEERGRIAETPTSDMTAYDLFLQGRSPLVGDPGVAGPAGHGPGRRGSPGSGPTGFRVRRSPCLARPGLCRPGRVFPGRTLVGLRQNGRRPGVPPGSGVFHGPVRLGYDTLGPGLPGHRGGSPAARAGAQAEQRLRRVRTLGRPPSARGLRRGAPLVSSTRPPRAAGREGGRRDGTVPHGSGDAGSRRSLDPAPAGPLSHLR